MLVHLSIRDIVLIDTLDLDLSDGLTVLTGETGAGKSILLDAFALALGARGDGGLVREGATQGHVTAVFDLAADHPAVSAATQQGITLDGDFIIRRVQMADGRTRAFINDQPVSGQALRTIVRPLVEIHGQHDDRALVNPATHRTLLDAFGGLDTLGERTRAAWQTLRALRADRASEGARVEAARAEADYLRHAHAELTTLAPEPGEEASLADTRGRMMGAEKVAAELRDAFEAVAGEHSPAASLAAVYRRLDRRRPQAPDLIDAPAQALNAALAALDGAGEALDAALRAAAYDPRELERVEERLFALRAASRKYAVEADALAAHAARLAADLAALDAGEAKLVALDRALVEAKTAYDAAAKALSDGRAAAATRLDKAVSAELAPLKLDRARFITHVEPDPSGGGPDGIDDVAFWVQTNPGTKAGPMMKVASGGELARFMLALKVVLADRGSAPTLVFDEIDTGVGGAVADAIGQRLARLAARVQVLAVTHAPQVAARAAGHFRIAKDAVDRGRRVATRVAALAPEARREEIARMLAGATVTDEARAAAGRLLEGTG